MTTVSELHEIAKTQWRDAPVDQWWKRAAYEALAIGRVQIITGRRGSDVYLLRCWLSFPSKLAGIGPEDGACYDSGNSLLLHHFLQPDDDGSLHDHPWPFRTRILSGGYVERSPRKGLEPDQNDPNAPGPRMCLDEGFVVGATIHHQATDLHAVVYLEPDTWTLVETGPRIRSWFFHPAGQPRVPWRDYLAALGKDVPPPREAAAAAS